MAEEYTEEQLQEILNRQKRLVQQLELSDAEQQEIFARAQTTGSAGQQAVDDFNRLETLFAQDEITANALRETKDEEFEARLDLGQYVPAGSPTQAPNNVSPAQSPAAEQAEVPTRRNNRQRAQAQRSAQEDPPVVQQAEETFDEFSNIQSDISVEPAVPTQDENVESQVTNRRQRAQAARIREREPADPTEDAEVNDQQDNRERAQAQRIENAAPGELSATSPAAAQVDSVVSRRAQAQINRFDRTVASDPTSYESLTDEQLRTQTASTQSALNSLLALPTQERLRVQAQIDALENQLDLLDQEAARRRVRGSLEDQVASGKRVPEPVDDQEAQDLDLVPEDEEIDFADEFDTGDEVRAAEARNAALENLKAQKAIKQERSPEAEGDWRVKLRLASGSTYLYKMAQNAGVVGNAGQPFDVGILAPLVPTDGIIFPYTPRISTLYQADYNTYSPTHSNYNAYWYKGSKVGEVQIDATFTAQDTNEANYLLAVIHFLKSASKMFYGQDPNRGSPPPLLFLSGLGTYQYNEHPCVITQFNYILPDDVDYIRAGSYQLDGNAAATQANIRNRNASNGPSWAGSTARRLMNGLPEGAEPKKPSGSINLSDSNATYVPTKMAINIVLLPVNNRLQVSQNFSLQEYGNGRLLTGGIW